MIRSGLFDIRVQCSRSGLAPELRRFADVEATPIAAETSEIKPFGVVTESPGSLFLLAIDVGDFRRNT
jgi:hypothetical protein